MLRSNELMIGDYLTFTDVQNDSNCPKVRVIAINEEDVYVSVDGDPVADLCDPKELAGIPITPEILRKNGFSQDILNGHIFYREKSGEVIYYEYGPKYGLTIDNQLATIQDLKIKYIHELQHCLKLCGINKTIEL